MVTQKMCERMKEKKSDLCLLSILSALSEVLTVIAPYMRNAFLINISNIRTMAGVNLSCRFRPIRCSFRPIQVQLIAVSLLTKNSNLFQDTF